MKEKPKFLIVCGKNKKRSRTAESIFKNDNRFAIRSVGVSLGCSKFGYFLIQFSYLLKFSYIVA